MNDTNYEQSFVVELCANVAATWQLSMCLTIYCFDAKERGKNKIPGILVTTDGQQHLLQAFLPKRISCWVHALPPHPQLLDAPKVVI